MEEAEMAAAEVVQAEAPVAAVTPVVTAAEWGAAGEVQAVASAELLLEEHHPTHRDKRCARKAAYPAIRAHLAMPPDGRCKPMAA